MSPVRPNLSRPARAAVHRRAWLAVLALLAALGVLAGPVAASESPLSLEYKVKAAYLYNFVKYVEWPSTESATNTPIVIGLVGGSEALPVLQQVLAGKTVDGRPLQVKGLAKPARDAGCQILFIHQSAAQTPAQIRQALGPAPILVVGESERFAENGGMIGFVREADSFRIHLNLDSATQSGLKVSAKLSSVARLVKTRAEP